MTVTQLRPAWTRRHFLRMSGAGFAVLAAGRSACAGESSEREDLAGAFQVQGVPGAFALYDVAGDRVITVNGKRAETRLVPASTFKIANSVIALETGVVKDENEIIPYGGKPQPFKIWEKDMSMREAIAISAVPIYQELARRVGIERYREWLTKLNYGNAEVGEVVDRFWLDGPLQISAVEQARFVAALALGKLPASTRTQIIVRDILKQEVKDGRILYAKTGWYIPKGDAQQIGWWTGWVDDGGKINAFSLNIDIDSVDDARKRQEIAKTLLAKLGLY
jgi:beta-lactamase class D